MSDEQIRNAFNRASPPINELVKQRSKRLAMAAFREENGKNSEVDQGKVDDGRLTCKLPNARKANMSISTKKLWFSGLAACCIFTIGALTLKSSFEQVPPSPKIIDELSIVEQVSTSDAIGIAESIPSSLPAQAGVEASSIDKSLTSMAEAKKEAVASRSKFKPPVESPAKEKRDNMLVKSVSPSHQLLPENELSNQPMVEDRNAFSALAENGIQQTIKSPVSTFSIDVDTASYSFMRRQLNRGVLPPSDAIRIEEWVNYFDYDYPQPKDKSMPFEPTVVVVDSPWAEGNKLVHIGIKGYDIAKANQPDSNLVFLLDVSGSMAEADRLPLVQQSMGLLLDTLKPTDSVAIVVYAGAAGAVLEPTLVKDKHKILAALNRLNAGGSTAGAQGLTLAYELAERNFKKESINRIILATDGDFNVGVTQSERLEDFVQRKRDSGIYLSVLGFGDGNYQDALMQTLAQNGNGIAAYIDTLSEAQKVLVDESTSSLFPIANDVKIQVEFNPKTVSEYRLIGYETRALKREDFNNDKVDSGDIGAGHTVTAIYEVTPVGSPSNLLDELRYGNKDSKEERFSQSVKEQEYGFLRLRYKLPGQSQSKLVSKSIPLQATTRLENRALQESVNFATAVTGFAQIMKGSSFIKNYSYDDVIQLAQSNKGADPFGYRTEFIQLVRKAKVSKKGF